MGNGENDIGLDVYIALPIRVYMVKLPLSSCPLFVVKWLKKLHNSVAKVGCSLKSFFFFQ